MSIFPVLINGRWRDARCSDTFTASDPTTGQALGDEYPVSEWSDIDEALNAARSVAEQFAKKTEPERIAHFLERYAHLIDSEASDLVEMAHRETGLAREPRLASVELPRTTRQLRLAATASREMSWSLPVIDTETNIRSCLAPIGPVCVMGPNNFPFAFGSVAGGDFAAAIAAGNPVIGKAHSSHPGTTRLFAELAVRALEEAGLPPATVQLVYRMNRSDGERLVADPRIGASGFTGSRSAGLALKHAADKAGKPIYLELSSLNPVVMLNGALGERAKEIAEEFIGSNLMASGQFCTKPGLVLLVQGEQAQSLLELISERYAMSPAGPLLSGGVVHSVQEGLQTLRSAGAETLVESAKLQGSGFCCPNVALVVAGSRFLENPYALQTEVFGNACLFVVADDVSQLTEIVKTLEGNLTGCVYSAKDGSDDAAYDSVVPALRSRVGRLLNDKMPTGVAVSPAMNHGGPYPSTGHSGFTAVGIPASMRRFGMLQCFDNVRPHRLPACLADRNPTGKTWRCIDGAWSCDDAGTGLETD